MRSHRGIAVALPLAALCFALAGSAVAQNPFDGTWAIELTCPADPNGALPFVFDFEGHVKGSVLHAERGNPGRPGWLTLDGPIGPDGGADLAARGLTGTASYNVGHTARGVAYAHPVTAHFDNTRGDGHWMTTRRCDFTFIRR